MKSDELNILLAMIGVSETEFDSFLYQLSEEYEDLIGMSGMYANDTFRSFWKMTAIKLSICFQEKISVMEDGVICYHVKTKSGPEYIMGQSSVRELYFKFLRKMVSQPMNSAVMELLKIKH